MYLKNFGAPGISVGEIARTTVRSWGRTSLVRI